MKQHNFIIAPCDTDSISFCKPDESEFTEEERIKLLVELNSLFPDQLVWEDDGYYPCVIALKTKNYILYDGKKIKTKGSALRDQKKPKALKEFQNEIIATIIANDDDPQTMIDIYMKYVKEIHNMTDISRWSSKKTFTDKINTSTRANETKVKAAILDSDYVEGDKLHLFFKSDNTLSLIENFNGDYHKDKLLESLYKSTLVFKEVLNTDDLFLNFKLKKSKTKLAELKII